jgi:hypothetical protein
LGSDTSSLEFSISEENSSDTEQQNQHRLQQIKQKRLKLDVSTWLSRKGWCIDAKNFTPLLPNKISQRGTVHNLTNQ